MKRAKTPESELPVLSKSLLEQERRLLLGLGNDITSVRDKNDLLYFFLKRLSKSLLLYTYGRYSH